MSVPNPFELPLICFKMYRCVSRCRCSISQFFVISPRGDTIIRQECELAQQREHLVDHAIVFGIWPCCLFFPDRGDIARDSAETFFRKVKFWKGDAPPAFVNFPCPRATTNLCSVARASFAIIKTQHNCKFAMTLCFTECGWRKFSVSEEKRVVLRGHHQV